MIYYLIIASLVFLYTVSKFRRYHYSLIVVKSGNPDLSIQKVRVVFYIIAFVVSLLWVYTIPEFFIKRAIRKRRNVSKAQQGQDQ
jgi:cellobiose-specific phosphotransferase system component IIC